MLAPNILPSLLALYSCAPVDEVVFLYTPGERSVEQCKAAILAHRNLLIQQVKGLQHFSFRKIDIFGQDILEIIPEEHREVMTVITPGTKSQGYFLTLLAGTCNGRVYSLETENQELTCLSHSHDENKRRLNGPDPAHLLLLKGESMANRGENADSLKKSTSFFRDLLAFLSGLLEQGDYSILAKLFTGNRTQQETISHGEFIYSEKKFNAELKAPSGDLHQWSFHGGEWFERLIGYVLLECGADDVRVRVRMKWRPKTQKRIKGNLEKGTGVFKEDIDVVARFKGRYYLISCKAGKKADAGIDDISREAMTFAHTIDRFCIPMVCFFKYNVDADLDKLLVRNNVPVFGCKTFLSPEKMKSLLEHGARRRTSRPVAG